MPSSDIGGGRLGWLTCSWTLDERMAQPDTCTHLCTFTHSHTQTVGLVGGHFTQPCGCRETQPHTHTVGLVGLQFIQPPGCRQTQPLPPHTHTAGLVGGQFTQPPGCRQAHTFECMCGGRSTGPAPWRPAHLVCRLTRLWVCPTTARSSMTHTLCCPRHTTNVLRMAGW